MTRQLLIDNFLNDYFGDEYQVVSLAGDASFRRYHRIYQGDNSYLLMDAPPTLESVQSFVDVATVLAEVVNVPDILKQDIANGLLLLQDFGETEFAHKLILSHDKDANAELYGQAMTEIGNIQRLDSTKSAVANHIALYDSKKLHDEMALFIDWFVPFIGYELSDNDKQLWQALTSQVVDEVLTQPQVVVHRDYHSRNLMIDKNSPRLGVIDFQDALIGAYSYDLVSLVRDAYIDVSEEWVMARLREYHAINGVAKAFDDFVKDVNVMGVQRHLKVLGIFVRLCQRDGKTRYLSNIPKVWSDLNIELTELSDGNNVYGQFAQFLDKITPNYKQKFQEILK